MRVLNVNLSQRSYDISIQKGLLENIGEEIKKVYKNKKIMIITDAHINTLYGHILESTLINENFIVHKIIIEPGEKSKSFATLGRIYDRLVYFEMSRTDLVIAFGGGVVGDLAGFAASTFLRGLPFIQIPTSLLAQIDSSIGGKVAVNLKQGKNLVGSFYQPLGVFIDPNLLQSLEKRYLYDGMAEVIKYGAIRDRALFENLLSYHTCAELLEHIEDIIYTCCDIKKSIVEKDEKDTGERMLLNFGHTIGHSIEKNFQYEVYTHGEAVAMGMYTITQASEMLQMTEKGTADQIKSILHQYHLPYHLPSVSYDSLIESIKIDKKTKGEYLYMVLLENIGNAFLKKISQKDIWKYIE